MTAAGQMRQSFSRTTRDGRELTYLLSVIQQPERARACGSGAKSSADRRPVDPPPVVELRILEGEEKADVTFSYNANFFVFAALESARPMLQGRLPPAATAQQQSPVLTGMPVSGMAYLDRPSEAGYFIFPDLSIRHEGKYCLSFNLYEETKDPKDLDPKDSSFDIDRSTASTYAPNGAFDWRLEVKSAAFTVFSAKKFPGLAESTVLSRTVAEQGCRVRIRRDVRMRRREGGKSSSKSSNRGEGHSSRHRRRDPTPAESLDDDRQDSVDNQGVDCQPQDSHRPPSNDATPASRYPAASTMEAPQEPTSYLASVARFTEQPQFQAPKFAQPAPPPPPPAVQTQQPNRQSAPSPYRQILENRSLHSLPGHPSSEKLPYPQHPREVVNADYTRPTVSYSSPSLSTTSQHTNAAESSINCSSTPHPEFSPSHEKPSFLAPIRLGPAPPLEPKCDMISSPGRRLSGMNLVPLSLPPVASMSSPAPSAPAPAPPSFGSEALRAGMKRPFGSVFSERPYSMPLYNGTRPSIGKTNVPTEEDDEAERYMQAMKLCTYKRADGTSQNRNLPSLK